MFKYTFLAFLLAASSTIAPSVIHKNNSWAFADASAEQSSEVGEAGVALTRLPNGATEMVRRPDMDDKLDPNELSLYSNTYLTKIDDVYVKGKSIEELRKLLAGPVNSEFEITYNAGQRSATKKLKRYPKSAFTQKNSNFGLLQDVNGLSVGWLAQGQNFCDAGKAYAVTGDNFLAAPCFIASLRRPKFIMPNISDDHTSPLPNAMDFFCRTGMYDRFDQCIKLAQSLADKLSATSSEADYSLVAKCATLIANGGSPKPALIIFEKLYRLMPRLTPATQIQVLEGRASLIETTQSEEAFSNYKQIVLLCDRQLIEPRDIPLEGLHKSIAFFIKNQRWDLAASAQKSVVEYQRKLDGYMIFRYQELVSDLLNLSQFYELAGASAKAESALNDALSTYNDNLDLNGQTDIERTVDLCPSIVRLKLSRLYAQNHKLDDAYREADAAKLLEASAFGVTSTKCQKIAQICDLLHTNNSQPSHSPDNTRQLELLSAFDDVINSSGFDNDKKLATKARNTEIAESMMARMAYAASKNDPKKACSIIEDLENHELATNSLTPDHATRLINLLRSVETPPSYAEASELFARLNSCLKNSPNRLSNNSAYAEVEWALLANSVADNEKASKAWDELTLLLKDMRLSRSVVMLNSDPERDEMNDLFCIFYIYLFNEEQSKSLAILHHIETNYQSYITPRSDIAYRTLLQTVQGNLAEARKGVIALLKPFTHDNNDYSREFTALGAALLQAGQGQLGLQVLDPNPSMRSTREIFAYRRAQIDYALGRFKDALDELNTIKDDGRALGSMAENYRLMKSNLFTMVGDTNQAILDLLKYDRGDYRQTLQTNKAVSLARTMTSIPTPTVEALVDAENRISHVYRISEIDDMKYLYNLAKERGVSKQKLDTLDFGLSHSEFDRSNPSGVIATLLERARSAEAKKKPGASQEWTSLAWEYFAQRKYDEGTAAILHAIQLPPAGSFTSMYYPGNLRQDLRFDDLLKAKQYSNAEKILKKSIEMRKSADYDKGAYIEKSFLTELYLIQSKFVEARATGAELVATLDGSLCPPPRPGYTKSSIICSTIEKFIDKRDFSTAQALLTKINKEIESQLGPSNYLFIEEYQEEAKLQLAQNRLTDAERFARKAFALENWYGGSHHTGTVSYTLLATILRNEGKDEEAEQVAAEHPVHQKAPQDLQKIWENGGRIASLHSPPPEIYAQTAEEPLKKILGEAIANLGAGSDDTINALYALTNFYMQQNRYPEAEQTQLRLLQLLDEQYGKCTQPKGKCFLHLAEIYVAEKKLDKAKRYAQGITEISQEVGTNPNRTSLGLAEVFLALGNRTKALEIARRVEKTLVGYPAFHRAHGDYYYLQNLKACLAIMEKYGLEKDIAPLRDKLKPFVDPTPQARHGDI